MNLTTIKALCAESGNPFRELCFSNGGRWPSHRSLRQLEVMDMYEPYVCGGLLEDVHVFARSFVYTKDGRVVFHCQSSQHLNYAGLADDVQAFILEKKDSIFQNYFEDECIFLGGMFTGRFPHGWSHISDPPNFGHFIFEFLSRVPIIELMRLPQHLPVVIYDCVPKSWEGFLELAGIAKERLVRVPILDAPAFRKVWVLSACNYRDTRGKYHFWSAGLHMLRQRVLNSVGGAQLDKRRRIYLGRDGARWRRIVNEDAVIDVLQQYGFEMFDVKNLTQRAQVEIISGAELVVNAVGAGGVLTHFAPEHCTIIDLAPLNAITGYWGGLGAALILGQVHERIDCEVMPSENTRLNIYGTNELADYKVDLSVLKQTLDIAVTRMANELFANAVQL